MASKPRKPIDLGLDNYNELFMNEQERMENRLPRIYEIPLSEIDEFPNHPFQVRMDEDMDQLMESVKERGVITPVTLRKKEDGRYETVSGHRRIKACELAGLETVPAEIKELTRDEAILLMVDSNLQRSYILPSEKAMAYKMRLDAQKRQGVRTDLTCAPVGHKLEGEKTVQIIADNSPDSKTQIQRYIRLTELDPDLLQLVDEGKIAMRPAVELSYLNDIEQQDLVAQIEKSDATPSHAQAIKMRNFSKEGRLTPEVIDSIMQEEKPNQRPKISFKYEELKQYMPSNVSYEKTSAYVISALKFYQRHLERRREQER
ncbi:MAG: ParB/RepB/Spo0J family partition protein [Clostridia bacterium]|nr:ParB/RepB/Spo0J family partition protein [Clostridia bacterium]